MTFMRSYKFAAAVAIFMLAGSSVIAQPGKDPAVPNTGNAPTKDGWLPSLTPDGAYDRVPHTSTPIPWQPIREADILWKKRVWREIDTREKANVGFRYAGDENTGGGMFIEILLDAIKRGKVKAYSAFSDDRFTTVLTKEQLQEQIAGKVDTQTMEDPVTGETIIKVIQKDFNPETITKYRIKEDWIFDRNVGAMVVRIAGIAPVKDVYGDAGDYRGSQPMFWLYYPEIRGLLAQYEVFNPHNDVYRYTWDEFFEGRQFSSKITKVSSPFGGLGFRESMSPMEALYESKHSAEEIFNKEVDMWVY